MKPNSQNATALKSVTSFGTVEVATADQGLGTGVDNSTYGRLYRMSEHIAATSDAEVKVRLRETTMLSKIRQLSPAGVEQVNEFVDQILVKEESTRHNGAFLSALASLSDDSLGRMWDNPKDAEYDNL